MKQVLQNLKDGTTEVVDVPAPRAGRGQLLIHTRKTLVSSGTERMLVDFGKANWIDKARSQPDKVRQVLDKVRTDGVIPTVEAVRHKLDQPLAMGYCNVGVVVEVGAGVSGFSVGDRVASNGKHAELVAVPVNLCAKIPADVSDEQAAFCVLGAIALQGIRLVQPTLGEAVVVTGLGLVGLLTAQLLRAHGCRVLGLDFDPSRVELGRRFGIEALCVADGADPVAAALAFSRGRGVDAVLVTASTKSSEPIHQAALMCRKRGRIVLVGVTGLELSRADFYEKELTFQVSCSYGPGRYDPAYEERGQDYPFGFVRWTEQRNLEAVLDMLADTRLDVDALISHRFDIHDAARAYDVVGGSEPSLGIVLGYPAPAQPPQRTIALGAPITSTSTSPSKSVGVSVIGSGNYASAVLVPAFAAAGASLRQIASSGGTSSVSVGRTLGFQFATTDVGSVLGDVETDLVVISTRHDSHADLVVSALNAHKHVFVEKPLALTDDDIDRIEQATTAHPGRLVMVGFNRRFAPHIVKAKALLQTVPGPIALTMTVNAGAIPANHWTQDREVGGGRIVGEACHFIDLFRFLVGAPIASHQAIAMAGGQRDTVVIQLRFEDGSIGSIHYLANGHKSVAKERLEIFAGGRILQLDNFRELQGAGWPGFSQTTVWRQDKGQLACVRATLEAIRRGGAWPIPLIELLEVARVTLAIDRSLS